MARLLTRRAVLCGTWPLVLAALTEAERQGGMVRRPSEYFHDPRVAELALAAASGQASRVRELVAAGLAGSRGRRPGAAGVAGEHGGAVVGHRHDRGGAGAQGRAGGGGGADAGEPGRVGEGWAAGQAGAVRAEEPAVHPCERGRRRVRRPRGLPGDPGVLAFPRRVLLHRLICSTQRRRARSASRPSKPGLNSASEPGSGTGSGEGATPASKVIVTKPFPGWWPGRKTALAPTV